MEKATQDNNILRLDTPLGKDVLHITKAEVSEGISTPFSISAHTFTNGQLIEAKSLVGKSVTIALLYNQGDAVKERYFNGHVSNVRSLGSRVSAVADGDKYQDYLLTISPTLIFLEGRTNCRIFQEENVEDIVKKILGEHKVKVSSKCTKTYPIYDYKVQYHETDLEFVSRLLAEEGIFYFFSHKKGEHTLVLADDVTAYQKSPEASVAFTTGSLAEAHIHAWSGGLDLPPGKTVKQGYDFLKPATKPKGDHVNSDLSDIQSKQEVFEYQAESEFGKRAKSAANVSLESLQRDTYLSSGSSNCRSFSPGDFFTFKSHEDKREEKKSYLLTRVAMEVSISSQIGSIKGASQTVVNQFTCVPKDVLYRPQQQASKPRIYGAQTAQVTGDPGDEIHVDKYGRVKVLFHWDREGKPDSSSSCWIRVAQNWAGNRWGAFFFPRVGQEVLIEFLDGDPDQPIISGALYNGDQMPPYALPANKTQSGIKTRSSKGGGDANFNEIRFEDDKGKELLYLHAEKDHQLMVENDQSDTIGNNRNIEITNNESVTIGGERVTDVGKSDKLTIGKELIIDAGSKITIKTGGASISMSSSGSIDIKGTNISINGSAIALKAGSIALN